jgi:iron complex outermembrane receptor protein
MNKLSIVRSTALVLVWNLAAPLVPAQAAPRNPEVIELSPFSVEARRNAGYGVSSSSTATRTNEKLIDIPQTVNIVTAELWEDTGSTSYDQALKYVGNVFVRNRAAQGQSFASRGFSIDAANGFAADGVRVYGYRRDLVAYDRVEVVKGPPSSVQGRGSNSGFVNFTYKKPVFGQPFARTKVTVGGYEGAAGFYRGELDVNRTLNAAGTVAGRVIGVVEKSDGYLDFQDGINEVYGVFPSLRWQIGESMELSVNAELLRTHGPYREPGQGFTFHPAGLRRLVPGINGSADPLTSLGLPRSFNAGGDAPGLEEETGAIFLSLVASPWENLSLRQVVNYFDYYHDGEWWDAAGNFPVAGVGGTLTNPYTWGRDKLANNGVTLQGDAIYEYGSESVPLTTMVGYAYSSGANDLDNYQGTPVPARFNFANPDYNRTITNARLAANSSYTDSTAWGLYLQQGADLFAGRLSLVGGFRRDFGENSAFAPVARTTLVSRSAVSSWRSGATFKITPTVALYGVVSVQNDPTATAGRFTQAPAGDPRLAERLSFTPETELRETGVKGEFLDGRMTATLAYYEISRTSTLSTFSYTEQNPPGSGNTVIITEQFVSSGDTSKGWEFQAFGSLTERLSLIASYANTSTVQPNQLSPQTGTQQITFTPKWSVNLYARYSLLDEEGNGWEVRGGGRVIGSFWSNATGIGPASRVFIDRTQTALDAGVSYQWGGRHEIDLQINNAGNDWFFLVRAEPPRSWRLSYRLDL